MTGGLGSPQPRPPMRLSALVPSLNRINDYLVRWIVQKYKRYRRRWMRARDALDRAAALYPGLFAHWNLVKAMTAATG
jgi:RNA-directed DNA polymerase